MSPLFKLQRIILAEILYVKHHPQRPYVDYSAFRATTNRIDFRNKSRRQPCKPWSSVGDYGT